MRNCLVLGSGRSGTSMVAGTLAKAGYFMGDSLLPETEGNPKGYFEDRLVNDINERLLQQVLKKRPWILGRWFFRDRPLEGQRWLGRMPMQTRIPMPPAIAGQIAAVTARQPFCFKDPRFCYTLPAWRPFLKDTVFVCVFRDPASTSASILKECKNEAYLHTIGMTHTLALKVWTLMYEHVLRQHCRDGAWMFFHYNQVLTAEGLDRLAAFVEAPVDRDFPEKSLRRSFADRSVPRKTWQVYEELCARAGYDEALVESAATRGSTSGRTPKS